MLRKKTDREEQLYDVSSPRGTLRNLIIEIPKKVARSESWTKEKLNCKQDGDERELLAFRGKTRGYSGS